MTRRERGIAPRIVADAGLGRPSSEGARQLARLQAASWYHARLEEPAGHVRSRTRGVSRTEHIGASRGAVAAFPSGLIDVTSCSSTSTGEDGGLVAPRSPDLIPQECTDLGFWSRATDLATSCARNTPGNLATLHELARRLLVPKGTVATSARTAFDPRYDSGGNGGQHGDEGSMSCLRN